MPDHLTPFPDIGLYNQPDAGDLVRTRFLLEAIARDVRVTMQRRFSTTITDIADLRNRATILGESRDGTTGEFVAEIDECLALVTSHEGGAPFATGTVQVAAAERVAAVALLDSIATLLPAPDNSSTAAVPVHFVTSSPNRAFLNSMDRQLVAPTWDEISGNYPPRTRSALAATMGDIDALARTGRLLLWHGPPGTGKTYALRALARQHRDRASVNYVTEPEILFGSGAHWITQFLETLDDDGVADDMSHWHILVLEDSDELIAADAKERAGQGMARLLNLTDGLLGQAFNVLVLLTTNEPVSRFHPAVVRPGRCASLVSFERFTEPEARDWLDAAGAPSVSATGAATLAELFALAHGRSSPEPRRRVGFAPLAAPTGPPPP